MEILYVIGMIAVFVLCLALLSTARRILRSSSLSSGQFGISRMYDAELPEDALEESSARMIIPGVEPAPFESALVLDEPLYLEAPTEAIVVETVASVDTMPTGEPAWSEELAEENTSEQRVTNKWGWLPKPNRQTYNYALECVLLGVSAWVLIKTQQGALRSRTVQTSRGRVA